MKHPRAKREVILGLLVGLVATLTTICQQAQDSVSFDILFPQNWYTRVLQSCMETWGDLDQAISDQDLSFAQRHMLVDSSIGKISYCLNCIENKLNVPDVDYDDLMYMIKIVYALDGKCDKLVGRQFDDKISCLKIRIKQLRERLADLL